MDIPEKYVDAYKNREMTLGEIADELGVAPSTVYLALREKDVDTSINRKKELRNISLVNEYAGGEPTMEDLARKYSITKQRVSQIVRSIGHEEPENSGS